MTYVENVYQGDHIAAEDLQNIENNFKYLRKNFRGTSSPADPGDGLEGVIWWDSSHKTFKGRSDTGWRAIFTGSASFVIWAYINAAEDGWDLVAALTDDAVLGLKSGAGTYTTGGQIFGQWQISGINNESAHTHPSASHNHSMLGTLVIADKSQSTSSLVYVENEDNWQIDIGSGYSIAGGKDITEMIGPDTDNRTPGDTGAGSAHTHTQDGNWRIRAVVGIMVYPEM